MNTNKLTKYDKQLSLKKSDNVIKQQSIKHTLKNLFKHIDEPKNRVAIFAGLLIVCEIGGIATCIDQSQKQNTFNRFFDYSIENGTYVMNGSINYNELKRCVVLEVSDFGHKKIYIAKKFSNDSYYNIFTNNCIFSSSDPTVSIVNESSLGDYLIHYEEVQSKYDGEDLERIFEKIKQDYVYENDKTLVKERN